MYSDPTAPTSPIFSSSLGEYIAQFFPKPLTATHSFDILTFVNRGSSGTYGLESRKPSENKSFLQNLATTGLRLIPRRSQVQVLPRYYQ